MAEYRLLKISLSEIDASHPFKSRYSLADEALKKSIEKRGLIQPLIVVRQDGQFCLLSGHKRFQALVELRHEEASVLEWTETHSKEDLFLSAILLNWGQTLLELDCAWVVYQASKQFQLSEEVIQNEIHPALGLPSGKNSSKEAQEIFSLSPAVLESIEKGKISVRAARTMGSFSLEDQEMMVCRVLNLIALSASQAAQIMEWLGDLIKIERAEIAQILESQDLSSILNDPNTDKRQLADQFFCAVRQMRFPDLMTKQVQFEKKAGEIESQIPDLKVQAPQSFEDQGLFLTARLRKQGELGELVERLQGKEKLLNSLFDIML